MYYFVNSANGANVVILVISSEIVKFFSSVLNDAQNR